MAFAQPEMPATHDCWNDDLQPAQVTLTTRRWRRQLSHQHIYSKQAARSFNTGEDRNGRSDVCVSVFSWVEFIVPFFTPLFYTQKLSAVDPKIQNIN